MLLSIWGSVLDRFWIPKSINIQFSYSTGSQNSLLCWPLNCQDLSSTKHLDVLRRFTTSLSSPLCSTWIGNVIRLSFLPPPLACSVYIYIYAILKLLVWNVCVVRYMDRNREITRIKREEIRRLKEHLTLLQQRLERYGLSTDTPLFSQGQQNLPDSHSNFSLKLHPFIFCPFHFVAPSASLHLCYVSVFLSGIWVTAQVPRGFLWQMSSSMPWSLLPANQCVPPQWKILTHQHPLVEQQDNNCHHQGEFSKKIKSLKCVSDLYKEGEDERVED